MSASDTAGFLGLAPRYCDYARSRVAILPIPYDATASYQSGSRRGPDAIIAASQHVEHFDDELERESFRCGIATCPPVEANASGPAAMHEDIHKAARRIVKDGKLLIGLGGEHGVTSGLVRAVASKHRKLSILQIDAHLDLRDSYNGTEFSHASVMRRCLDYADTIVPVGIRSRDVSEQRFLRKAGIKPISAYRCHESDDWIDEALETLGDKVYVTIDIDGFDPAYAPGTGTPEPGGLDWHQVTGLLKLVAAEKTIVGADVVEVLPLCGQVITEFLAAKLVYRLIGYITAAESGDL